MCKGGKVARKLKVSSNGQKGMLKRKFHSLSYYCTHNLSFHQNNTKNLTGSFLEQVYYTM